MKRKMVLFSNIFKGRLKENRCEGNGRVKGEERERKRERERERKRERERERERE